MIVPSKHSLSSGALTVCHFYIVISVFENKKTVHSEIHYEPGGGVVVVNKVRNRRVVLNTLHYASRYEYIISKWHAERLKYNHYCAANLI